MATIQTATGRSIVTARMIGATPSQAEPKYIAWGTGSGSAAVSDVAMIVESAESRVAGTSSQVTVTTTDDTYQATGTITSASTQTITEFGLLDGATKPPSTTLSAAITTTGATTMSVASASSFPGSGTYDVQIDSEAVTVTGGQGTTTWTITRGANGSTAATHSSGAVVTAGNGPGQSAIAAGGNLYVHSTATGLGLNNGDSITPVLKMTYS